MIEDYLRFDSDAKMMIRNMFQKIDVIAPVNQSQ